MINKKTILIAGGTGNIGKPTALALVKRGTRVVILGRNPDKLKARVKRFHIALSEAKIDYQKSDVEMLAIDFSDMDSVRFAAAEALNRFPVIDGLILSVVTTDYNGPTILPSGHEMMFATNVMGPFLFTRLLIDRLLKSKGIILNVTAMGYKKIDWDDLESIKDFRTIPVYDKTKTCNRAIIGELARRYGGKITSVAFDPILAVDKNNQELKEKWPKGIYGLFWKIMSVFFAKPSAEVAESIVNLVLLHPDHHSLNGNLFRLDKRIKKPDKAMNDKELGKRLWIKLEQMTGQTE